MVSGRSKPQGLPKTMMNITREQARRFILPTHYGSIVGKPEDAHIFRRYVDQAIVVETRL